MRVPGKSRVSGSIPLARGSSAVAAILDLVLALAGLAGAGLPSDSVLGGRDLWPPLSGAT